MTTQTTQPTQRRQLTQKVSIVAGMPDEKDPIYASWHSESLTKLMLGPNDAAFFKLFIQEPDISYHMKIDETGEVIALSGTCRWDRYQHNVLKIAEEIAESKECSNGAKTLALLNELAVYRFKQFTEINAFHNTGLLVKEAYRGYEIDGKSIGRAMFEAKLKELKRTHSNGMLLTNANNAGSAKIFDETMTKFASIDYELLGIKHPGAFNSYTLKWDWLN